MPTCKRCGKEGEYGIHFTPNRCICKRCRADEAKIYKTTHPEKYKASGDRFRKNNKEKLAEAKADYYKKNAERMKSRVRELRLLHPEHHKEIERRSRLKNADKIRDREILKRQRRRIRIRELTNRHYSEHKEEIRERVRRWRKTNRDKMISYRKRRDDNPVLSLHDRVRHTIKNALRKGQVIKKTSTLEMLGVPSYEFLLQHLGGLCRPGFDIDHICPVAQAQDEQELLKLQHYTNLRYMDHSENLAKSNHKTPEGEHLCRILLGRGWI